jgi:hypothetical protein
MGRDGSTVGRFVARLIAVAALGLGSLAAMADQDKRKLTPEESIVAFEMPGLKGARESHDRWYTDSWGQLIHLSEQWNARAPGLPRALVRVSDVQRGFKFEPPDQITQKWIENRSGFFRRPENPVKITSSRQSSDGQVREARFTAGPASCYALSVFGSGLTTGETLQQVGRRSVIVIYCGAPDQALDDAMIEAVKKGYRLKG